MVIWWSSLFQGSIVHKDDFVVTIKFVSSKISKFGIYLIYMGRGLAGKNLLNGFWAFKSTSRIFGYSWAILTLLDPLKIEIGLVAMWMTLCSSMI